MSKKYFTPEEADALLPYVRQDILALQRLRREFEDEFGQLQALRTNRSLPKQIREEQRFQLESGLEFKQIEFDALYRSLTAKGAELKDLNTGLVDFPALLNGEEVLLCWRLGEARILHYHGLYDGFAGRKPLPGDFTG